MTVKLKLKVVCGQVNECAGCCQGVQLILEHQPDWIGSAT